MRITLSTETLMKTRKLSFTNIAKAKERKNTKQKYLKNNIGFLEFKVT